MPPVADTVQLNGLPAVSPVLGQSTVTVSGLPPTGTVWTAVATTLLASRVERVTVFEPLVAYA